MELSAASFYDCLSSCMKEYATKCRSIEYSHLRQVCRFSGNQVVGPLSNKDKDALIDDETFDYYQFMWSKCAHPDSGLSHCMTALVRSHHPDP